MSARLWCARRCCCEKRVCRLLSRMLFRRTSAVCVLERYAARLQRRADTGVAHDMQQTEMSLHLLGTAPPIPPPPLLQSLPEPTLIPGCGRRAYVAGGEGLHTTRTAWQHAAPPAWSARIGTRKQASAKHRKTGCVHADPSPPCSKNAGTGISIRVNGPPVIKHTTGPGQSTSFTGSNDNG